MPHSTQTRTRCVGCGVFDEKRRFRNDIQNLHDFDCLLSYGTGGSQVTSLLAIPAKGRRPFIRFADPEKGWEVEAGPLWRSCNYSGFCELR